MSYKINAKSNATMRELLGDAVKFIDSEQFLGVYRNRQKNYEKEFNASVKMVKSMLKSGKIKNAKRYFATIWSKKNTETTIEIVKKFINRKIAKEAEKREQSRRNLERASIASNFNGNGHNRYRQRMIERGLLTS